jgi:aminoglycoside N3'-acetyltransferase
MAFPELRAILAELLPRDGVPVVAYSAVWSLAAAWKEDRRQLVGAIYEELLEAVGPGRTLIMPTYTGGFKDGVIDLDSSPGLTGVLNEAVRKTPGSKRTASAFFSFTARGPQAEELAALRPRDAWGEGSLFEWIEQQNAHILLLGVPLPMCSFLHRVEWNACVPYRYGKNFAGTMIRDGKREPLEERLFVRSLDPLVENIWPGAEAVLGERLRRRTLGRGEVSVIGAKPLVDTLLTVLRRDPFAFVKNPEVLRQAFEQRAAEGR